MYLFERNELSIMEVVKIAFFGTYQSFLKLFEGISFPFLFMVLGFTVSEHSIAALCFISNYSPSRLSILSSFDACPLGPVPPYEVRQSEELTQGEKV